MGNYTPPAVVFPDGSGGGIIDGQLALQATNSEAAFPVPLVTDGTAKNNTLDIRSSGELRLGKGYSYVALVDDSVMVVGSNGSVALKSGVINIWNGINGVENGLAPIRGSDSPRTVVAPDGGPITIYGTPAGGPYMVRIMLAIDVTAYTSGTITYTCSYTAPDGNRSFPLTASAVGPANSMRPILVAGGANINVQVSGTFSATAVVSASVEVISAGA